MGRRINLSRGCAWAGRVSTGKAQTYRRGRRIRNRISGAPATRRMTQYSHNGAPMIHQDQSAHPISLALIGANVASEIQTNQFTGVAPRGYTDFMKSRTLV